MTPITKADVTARWPTGTCALCGRNVKVRWDGTVWAHRGGKPDPNFNCFGTGRPPKESTTLGDDRG